MADTQNGLRMAPARMKADALTATSVMAQVAQMSDEEREKLKAELADPMDPEDEDETDGEKCDDKAKDKKSDPACDANASDDFKAGVASANARMKTVFASEHFAGREARAAAFLQTSMSADEIVGLLATEPKASAKDEDSGAADIVNAIRGANANVDAGGDAGSAPAAANPWKKATAAINKRNGF